jgi:hypothetical protein
MSDNVIVGVAQGIVVIEVFVIIWLLADIYNVLVDIYKKNREKSDD